MANGPYNVEGDEGAGPRVIERHQSVSKRGVIVFLAEEVHERSASVLWPRTITNSRKMGGTVYG